MRLRAPGLALAALLLAACVAEMKLQPPPTAPTTRGGSALAEDQGVRLVADGDAWRDTPSDLEQLVTPVRVRLENQSGRPLRVAYEHFVLVGTSRFHYAALSPFEVRDEGLALGGSGPATGDSWGPWGPGWRDPWYDPWYDPFSGPFATWDRRPPEPLPTRDMLRQALPEGLLEPGGTVTGFLYFQDVSEREGRVTLQARLVDARTGEQFGTLSIPFDVRS